MTTLLMMVLVVKNFKVNQPKQEQGFDDFFVGEPLQIASKTREEENFHGFIDYLNVDNDLTVPKPIEEEEFVFGF